MPSISQTVLAGGSIATLAALGAFAAPVHGGDPIPTTRDAYTMADYNREETALNRAQLIGGYEQGSYRDPAWDDDALQILEWYIARTTGDPAAPTLEHIRSFGRPVVGRGCEDPFVQYVVGWAHVLDNNLSGGEKYLRASAEALLKSDHPPSRLGLAASWYARFLEVWDRPDEARRFHEMAADAFVRALLTAPQTYYRQRRLVNDLALQLKDHLPADLALEFIESIKVHEDIDRCTFHTVVGIYHIRAAWDARGPGLGHTVTDEGWAGFARHLEQAREHLTEAYRLDPARPEAATQMITVAMGGYAAEGQDERYWFDRAVAAQMDWASAYSKFTYALRPRWGGSHQAMYAFALECAATERYDTEVPFELINALIRIEDDESFDHRFWRERDVYQHAAQVLAGYSSQPERAPRSTWYKSHLAMFAWACGRYNDARTLAEELGDELDEEVLARIRTTPQRVVSDSIAFSSTIAHLIREGDAALGIDEARTALLAFGEAKANAKNDEALNALLTDRMVTAARYARFLDDDWVKLTFEDGLPGWHVHKGAWHSSETNQIKGGPTREGLLLLSRAPVGPRFELRGIIDTSKLINRNTNNTSILFQYRDDLDRSDWLSFQIFHREKRAWIGYRYWKVQGDYVPLGDRRVSLFEFHLQNWDNQAVLHINGQQVFAGRLRPGEHWIPGHQIGLGGSYASFQGYTRFKNLELRRLTSRPAALSQ